MLCEMQIDVDPQKADVHSDGAILRLIPPPSGKELKELEESLLKEGCRDSIVVWKLIILDGNNRFRICKRHGIKLNISHYDDKFKNLGEAQAWVIANQLGRRNLDAKQIKLLRGRLYNLRKESHGGQTPRGIGQNDPSLSTAQKIAKECGVSEATIKRDAKLAEAVDKLPEGEKQEILSGKSKKTMREIVCGPRKENKDQKEKDTRAIIGKEKEPFTSVFNKAKDLKKKCQHIDFDAGIFLKEIERLDIKGWGGLDSYEWENILSNLIKKLKTIKAKITGGDA